MYNSGMINGAVTVVAGRIASGKYSTTVVKQADSHRGDMSAGVLRVMASLSPDLEQSIPRACAECFTIITGGQA